MKTGPKEDRIGRVYERWTVISFDHSEKSYGSFYLCRCQCGTERVIVYRSLREGTSKSCGCLQKDGRSDPYLITARYVWNAHYNDGCSFEKFLELSQQPCYYCGSPPSNKYNVYVTKKNIKKINAATIPDVRAHEAWFTYNGLDRLDSSKPHTEDNIVPCCYVCNTAKLDLTIDEFRDWIIRIHNKFVMGNK